MLVRGVVNRQAACVRLDPYANAFRSDATRISEHAEDQTEMRPGVHERKYELHSLCAVMRLACGYDGGCHRPAAVHRLRLALMTRYGISTILP